MIIVMPPPSGDVTGVTDWVAFLAAWKRTVA